jgi:hypothetical protein
MHMQEVHGCGRRTRRDRGGDSKRTQVAEIGELEDRLAHTTASEDYLAERKERK